MRITLDEKIATRDRILAASGELFRSRGFEATTTRDIALAAGIATGTLFNYFSTKEAIVQCLAVEALNRGRAAFSREAGGMELEEELFALIAHELRQLRPVRKFILPLLETTLSPLAGGRGGDSADALRAAHLELVAQTARRHGIGELSPVALQMYWTLYTGVLAFWSTDKSPKQEDTLALLDESMGMFCAWLRGTTDEPRS